MINLACTFHPDAVFFAVIFHTLSVVLVLPTRDSLLIV